MLSDKLYFIAQFGHDFTLLLLLILSVFSLGFIIERWLFLHKEKTGAKLIQDQIKKLLQDDKLDQIQSLDIKKRNTNSTAIDYGLRHINKYGNKGLDELFESYILLNRSKLEKHLNFLATVGSNAPFIGLLGTVFGIMDAFKELAVSKGEATLVMLGISKALVATAIGLLVAIPAVIAYNKFKKTTTYILNSVSCSKDICVAYAKTIEKEGH